MTVSLYINHYIRIYCYVTTHRIGPKQIYTTKIFSLKNIRRILWDEPCKLNIMIVKLKLSWFCSSMNPVKPQRLNTKGGSAFTRESLESWLSISRKFIRSYRNNCLQQGLRLPPQDIPTHSGVCTSSTQNWGSVSSLQFKSLEGDLLLRHFCGPASWMLLQQWPNLLDMKLVTVQAGLCWLALSQGTGGEVLSENTLIHSYFPPNSRQFAKGLGQTILLTWAAVSNPSMSFLQTGLFLVDCQFSSENLNMTL